MAGLRPWDGDCERLERPKPGAQVIGVRISYRTGRPARGRRLDYTEYWLLHDEQLKCLGKIQRAPVGRFRRAPTHYLLCVKENHPNLHDSILFADIDPRGPLTPSSTHETTIKDHGRIEIRRCHAYTAIDRLYKSEDWEDLASFAVVERIRTVGDHTSTERVFYISSLPADAERPSSTVTLASACFC